GLDVGPHQDGWCPYQNIPVHWNHDDREESESELQVSSILTYSASNSMIIDCSRDQSIANAEGSY
ncbi:hypothetical protein B0H14DRAFT_2366813, partial [Mycena olivaceomarginata]